MVAGRHGHSSQSDAGSDAGASGSATLVDGERRRHCRSPSSFSATKVGDEYLVVHVTNSGDALTSNT